VGSVKRTSCGTVSVGLAGARHELVFRGDKQFDLEKAGLIIINGNLAGPGAITKAVFGL